MASTPEQLETRLGGLEELVQLLARELKELPLLRARVQVLEAAAHSAATAARARETTKGGLTHGNS